MHDPNQTKLDFNIAYGHDAEGHIDESAYDIERRAEDEAEAAAIADLDRDIYNYGDDEPDWEADWNDWNARRSLLDDIKHGAHLTPDYLEGVDHGAIFGVCVMLNALASWYEDNPDLTSRTHYERLNQFSRFMCEAAEYAEGTTAGAYYGAYVKTRNLSRGFLNHTQTSDTAAEVLRNYAEDLEGAHNHRYPN